MGTGSDADFAQTWINRLTDAVLGETTYAKVLHKYCAGHFRHANVAVGDNLAANLLSSAAAQYHCPGEIVLYRAPNLTRHSKWSVRIIVSKTWNDAFTYRRYRSDYEQSVGVAGMNFSGELEESTSPSIDLRLLAIESALEVQTRPQFFKWLLSRVSRLLPDQVAICGAWDRAQRVLVLEHFNSIVLPAPTVQVLTDASSAIFQQIVASWAMRQAPVAALPLSALETPETRTHTLQLTHLGICDLLVYAVARPKRLEEIESIFIFGSPGIAITPPLQRTAQVLGPHIHRTYLRVLDSSATAPGVPPTRALAGVPPADRERLLTLREHQILCLVRDGLSNAGIGEFLRISPLTAKNHVQAVLRKLSANNRAQAVAQAFALGLLGASKVTEQLKPTTDAAARSADHNPLDSIKEA